jgi:hypothetical protein
MSLTLLPRGVAARRPLTKANVENSTMDVDLPQPSSSGLDATIQVQLDEPAKKGLLSRETKWQPKKQKQRPIESRELALLMEASMSDYSLWKSHDLRRYAADKNTQGCKYSPCRILPLAGLANMY